MSRRAFGGVVVAGTAAVVEGTTGAISKVFTGTARGAPLPFAKTPKETPEMQKWKYAVDWFKKQHVWIDMIRSPIPDMTDEERTELKAVGGADGYPYTNYSKALLSLLQKRIDAKKITVDDAINILHKAYTHSQEYKKEHHPEKEV
jgi:hypothetical protein